MENNPQSKPKLFSSCYLHESLGGAFSSQPAIAIWYADDRVGVYSYDTAAKKYTAKYLECSVQEIQWVMATMANLTLRVHDRNYGIDFDPAAFQTFMASGAVGAAVPAAVVDAASIAGGLYADTMSRNSGVDEWLAAFKNAGIKTDVTLRNPGATSLKWGLMFGAALFGLMVVGAFIFLLFE